MAEDSGILSIYEIDLIYVSQEVTGALWRLPKPLEDYVCDPIAIVNSFKNSEITRNIAN